MMKKILTVILFAFLFQSNAQINDLYLVLDKSKLGLSCNLDGAIEVWMHSGACTSSEIDCNSLNISAWENMAPVDWGLATGYEPFTFMDSSNGLYYLTLNLADAYELAEDVYSIGLIFRDNTGLIFGQASDNCGDIFITNIQDETPQVFQGDGTLFDGVIATNPLSLEDIITNQVIVYPNPTIDNISISFDLNFKTEVSIILYNTIGKKIDEVSLGEKLKGSHKIRYNFKSSNTEGLYFVTLQTSTKMITFPVLKQ